MIYAAHCCKLAVDSAVILAQKEGSEVSVSDLMVSKISMKSLLQKINDWMGSGFDSVCVVESQGCPKTSPFCWGCSPRSVFMRGDPKYSAAQAQDGFLPFPIILYSVIFPLPQDSTPTFTQKCHIRQFTFRLSVQGHFSPHSRQCHYQCPLLHYASPL
jgi:hypothetical protein